MRAILPPRTSVTRETPSSADPDSRPPRRLGLRYGIGAGVPKDARAAAAYFERGCEGGHARACAELATIYREGRGVPRDGVESRRLAGRACDLGVAEPCWELALLRRTELAVTEICFAVGFESLGSFSSLFRRRVGASPSEFRKRPPSHA